MSSLICFPNKLAKPGTAALSEFAFAADGSKPAVDGADGEGVDFMSMGASCSLDPENAAASGLDGTRVEECGKRLSDSLWASEDLSCRSEIRQDIPASRGSPEWTGTADSQRAISLDASECLTEISNLSGTSLVRSTALEDLTSIGDRSLWVAQGEELISSADMKGGLTADNSETLDVAALKSCSGWDSGTNKISPERQQPLHTQSLSCSSFGSGLAYHSEDLQRACDSSHPAHSSRNVSERDSLCTQMPSDIATENIKSDSSLDRAGHSKSDTVNDSEMSTVVQTTNTTELQKTHPSPPARKSLVPIAIFKGLFAVMFTNSEPALLS